MLMKLVRFGDYSYWWW